MQNRLIATDGPHISVWAVTIAALTRIAEHEEDERKRTRRFDRRIRKIVRWVHKQNPPHDELVEMLAAAVVALLEENKDRKKEVDSNYSEYIRNEEMEKAGAWLAGNLRKIKSHLIKGGRNRHANSPVQGAKTKAKVLWEEREAGKHPGLRTEDQFAIEACRRWPELTSIGTVKKWSTAWRKEANARRRSRNESASTFANVPARRSIP